MGSRGATSTLEFSATEQRGFCLRAAIIAVTRQKQGGCVELTVCQADGAEDDIGDTTR